ncbi:viperin family antiviral radical SAM protein [Marinobacter pelagius]|uniref:viperin family antiviral radical SAM protein n=1 Tax=Marinobacter sp. C7 TaxID=2951363 RepID=UPI001EF01BF5|nr:viperin family antiviral radical SAM protein [Marinobacter sp. C7]MCG7201486.1 viperin family antiviral radical SAM protein [Marinobacter sp. C7]
MLQYTAHNPKQLVINWHLTEACNYSCRYCYAHWQRHQSIKDLIHQEYQIHQLLLELREFFDPINSRNPLAWEMAWSNTRLNIAGGEPLLFPSVVEATLKYARRVGLRASMITNGSLLTEHFARRIGAGLEVLGISIDSARPLSNQLIGRVDSRGTYLDLRQLEKSVEAIRERNPAIKIKLNTVVNRVNWQDDFSDLISFVQPDKWKVLRVLPVTDDSMTVSDEQFRFFLDRHRKHRNIVVAEDNADMVESYIMVDPQGRFFQNSSPCASGYQYSQPILEVGAEKAFSQIEFDAGKFSSRYPTGIGRSV